MTPSNSLSASAIYSIYRLALAQGWTVHQRDLQSIEIMEADMREHYILTCDPQREPMLQRIDVIDSPP